jgi:hypothetical protein
MLFFLQSITWEKKVVALISQRPLRTLERLEQRTQKHGLPDAAGQIATFVAPLLRLSIG